MCYSFYFGQYIYIYRDTFMKWNNLSQNIFSSKFEHFLETRATPIWIFHLAYTFLQYMFYFNNLKAVDPLDSSNFQAINLLVTREVTLDENEVPQACGEHVTKSTDRGLQQKNGLKVSAVQECIRFKLCGCFDRLNRFYGSNKLSYIRACRCFKNQVLLQAVGWARRE